MSETQRQAFPRMHADTETMSDQEVREVEESQPEVMLDRLVMIACSLIREWPRLTPMLGPARIENGVKTFKEELRSRAFAELGADYSQKCPMRAPAIHVDFHIGNTVVQIALDLRNWDGELERGILKAIMFHAAGYPVKTLVFLAKAGAHARCRAPFSRALIEWVRIEYGIRVYIRELGDEAEAIFDTRND